MSSRWVLKVSDREEKRCYEIGLKHLPDNKVLICDENGVGTFFDAEELWHHLFEAVDKLYSEAFIF